jgi:hypothetical protein
MNKIVYLLEERTLSYGNCYSHTCGSEEVKWEIRGIFSSLAKLKQHMDKYPGHYLVYEYELDKSFGFKKQQKITI